MTWTGTVDVTTGAVPVYKKLVDPSERNMMSFAYREVRSLVVDDISQSWASQSQKNNDVVNHLEGRLTRGLEKTVERND